MTIEQQNISHAGNNVEFPHDGAQLSTHVGTLGNVVALKGENAVTAQLPKNSNDQADLSSPIKIGGLTCRNRVFLAPMSGISDVAFRKLAWRFGAGLVFSEMVASEALVDGRAEMVMKAQSAGLPIHAVQIAGRQAKWMRLAAKMAADNGADLIDINMGCPSRRVTSGYSGSALMRDLDNALELIEAVVGAVKLPVTLKMRLGWDENSINAPQLAARAQAAGVSMITVHGRTRCQFYKGTADWRAVRAVREMTSLPLVINGDIVDHPSAHEALAQSQGDAVMVGRASCGAPWLAAEIAYGNKMLINDEAGLVLEHFDEMLSQYGIAAGIRRFRKHLGWYLDNLLREADASFTQSLKNSRLAMMVSLEPDDIRHMIGEIYNERIDSGRVALGGQ